MNPITHFLVGWVGFERIVPSMRDKGLIAIAGVLPDLDGVGIVVDFSTRMLGLPPTDYYQHYHRLLGHGLPAAIMIAALVAGFGRNRRAVFGLAFLAVHLHLLCDILGSRGSTPLDLWPIYYFAPIRLQPEFCWSGQW
ncbi:MAG: metal-dependent hydrolase, partial [Xanthomonadales bacterium]|nr:metal-dependent hydrolase [Xanthomonadales bacterium]